MNPFSYRSGVLHVEDVPLDDLARAHGTPLYVYIRSALTAAYTRLTAAFSERDHLICYAVKANPTLAVLDLFARLGSGFDIVSGGELQRVIAAGGDPGKVVFSGVGKTAGEIRDALRVGILCFNVESEAELLRLDQLAGELGCKAPVSLRVNPDVDAGTHPYISTGLKQNKFGVAFTDALALYGRAARLTNVQIKGIDCHIGSQLTDLAPMAEAFEKVAELVGALGRMGIELEHIDVGGGLGIRYREETPPPLDEYARVVRSLFADRYKLMFEPGRLLVGNGGVLLTRVEYLKRGEDRHFAIVDAAMNDLLRPALYEAWHEVRPVNMTGQGSGAEVAYDIVGPVCETGDFLARGRRLAIAEGDLLSIMSAGAYGMSMASNYNTRARAAEVMVEGSSVHLIRSREEVSELYSRERRLPA